MRGVVVELDTHATWGGGQYQVLALVTGLARRGVPTLLVAHASGPLARRAREAGVRVLDLPPALARRWHPAGGRWLHRYLGPDDVALYHAHDSRALTLALRAARRHPAPVVLSRRVDSPLHVNLISRLRYSPRRLAAIVATSRVVAGVVAARFPADRTFVVESATDIADLARKGPDEDLRRWAGSRPLVGSVGKLVPKKNWELLVRTAAALRSRGHDVRWLIAGGGPEGAALAALGRELGVDDIVRIDGGDRDPERVVKSLDLMFHPARREGSSAIVRVAMLSGVPVIIARATALVDAVGEHGVVVGPDDVVAAAAAVERLLAVESERRRLADGALAAATIRYGIDQMVEGTRAVYETVLRGTGGVTSGRSAPSAARP